MKQRLLSLFLALTLLLPLAACSNGETQESGTATDTPAVSDPTGGETEPAESAKTYFDQAWDAQGNQTFDGMSFKILSPDPGAHFYNFSGPEENEVYYETSSAEALSNSIYMRNLRTEENLGVKIEPVWGGDPGSISTTVRTNSATGDRESFHVVLNRTDSEITSAANGFFLNFFDIATIELTNPWWDEQITSTFTLYGDQLFVLSGDINYYDDYAVLITLFNKNLCAEAGLEYPYDSVREGKWTLDLMTSMAEAVSRDLNGDGVKNVNDDVMGIAENMYCLEHFIYSFDLSMSTKNEEGVPEVVWVNDLNTSAVEKMRKIFTSDYSVISYEGTAYFLQGNLLFLFDMLGVLPNYRNMEADFGILPQPKNDESMNRYKAYVSNGWSTSYAIPSTFLPSEASSFGTILECMSAASKDYVTPALYEQLLQAKYVRDRESTEMLDYILDSKVYDLAGDLDWAGSLRGVYDEALNADVFASKMASITKLINKSLEKFCKSFEDLKNAE